MQPNRRAARRLETSRRKFLTGAAATLAAPALLRGRAFAADGPVRIGFVTPQTGPLAFFGEPDAFVFKRFEKLIGAGVQVNGATRPIEIIVKDSQSNANRAAEVASQLLLEDEVSLLLSAGGPDTVNPVADQAEANGTPMIATACPWQPFVFGRGSTPDKGFDWTYLFAFGLEDVIAAYMGLWATIETNKRVGILLPNDADGSAWGDAKFGFPPALQAAGYEVIDTGRYTPMLDDFTAQISALKSAEVDIVMGTMLPPEFFSFWSQSAQQGLRPKVATIGKTLLLPATLEAVGEIGDGLSTELGWHPTYPFTSAATGETAQGIADAWEAETGRQWIQTIGMKHALLDLAIDVVSRAGDPQDPVAVVEAIRATDRETTLGRANWAASPVRNVAKAPMVGGQWRKTDDKFELVVCSNPAGAAAPATSDLLPLRG
ncbi:MAG: ABC transporter substrate-binding protein [Mesorhizobium sp.]|nr:ABC transporter substrate-binding protein [Mesorhizobium sp.]MCO5162695.1 ABC transporter substrate-binding protein [Mesorhizobium sp.]